MTVQGVVVLDLLGVGLLLWVLSLVRRDRLYVGYGIMFIVLIVSAMGVISITPILALITRMVGAVFPASALTLLALCFIVVMLVYVLSQLTIISNRLAVTVQELAIQASASRAVSSSPEKSPAPLGGRASPS